LASLFSGKKQIDPSLVDEIEEVMLTSDVGVATTQAILGRLRDRLSKQELGSPDAVWDALREEALRILAIGGGRIEVRSTPTVVFMVGVNGVGKTTTIGKIATKLTSEQRSVTLAAGDTFRAAAVQQLEIWGRRVGCEVVRGKEGSDPASVIFNAIQIAKEKGIDVVLADTAGRLQTKTPLMDELKKIVRTMQKALEGAPQETLLVLDATNGQNAISQAKMFKEAIPLTGIVLTKLDGTAKGGVILGICDELKIPVRYVGLGERAEDLREFVAEEFVEALFGRSGDAIAAA
jgi:fused signal recognition particle receptor